MFATEVCDGDVEELVELADALLERLDTALEDDDLTLDDAEVAAPGKHCE